MKQLSLFLLFLSLSLPASAQKPAQPVLQEGTPASVGVSPDRLARLDRVLQQYVDSGQQPGIVALLVRDGKIIYHKSFGQDDVAARTPLRRDAIVRIASQTKAITSIGLMLLFEEGKFLLDDPVSKYIPAFKNVRVLDKLNEKDTTFTTVPAKREITIQHLLTHTSGISYPVIGGKEFSAIYAKYRIPSGIGTPDGNLADAITRLAALPLAHQPGERWTYGLNTDVAGYLIEVLSGQSLSQFLQTRLFGPLGMKDTHFYLPADRQNRLAKLYTEDSTGRIQPLPARGGLSPDYPKQAGTFYSGGAGLSSTAYDYAIFLQMLLNGGTYNGRQLLSPATVRMITSNQIGELSLGANKFGLGFGLYTDKTQARIGASVGSFDWGGIFGTSYWADPKEKIVGVLLTQKYPNTTARDLNDKFRVLVYQALTSLHESR